jgi:hypothetical protein
MAVVFFVLAGMLLFWSGIKLHVIYLSIVDSFPPQFQDEFYGRYAFSVLVLSSPTPLPVQEEYMKASLTSVVGFLCISLGFFVAGNIVFGCFTLGGVIFGGFTMMRSWKTYRNNRERQRIRDEMEET